MGGDGEFSIVAGVAGVDGWARSRLALKWAGTEARLRNGQIRAVTAFEFPPPTVGMEDLVWDPDVFPKTARHLQNEALNRVDSEGVTVTRDVVQGNAATVLLRAAETDLLVVGSRGLGGFIGLLLGSVFTQVLHHSPCPVLVVRNRSRTAGEE
ncbi:universal stress protein [Arthrobacter sp. RHLT1-20]